MILQRLDLLIHNLNMSINRIFLSFPKNESLLIDKDVSIKFSRFDNSHRHEFFRI